MNMNEYSDGRTAGAPKACLAGSILGIVNASLACLLAGVLAGGCRSASPLPPRPAGAVASPSVPDAVDDISANASPAVRAHLIKLRELRDRGVISDDDYRSRKANLRSP